MHKSRGEGIMELMQCILRREACQVVSLSAIQATRHYSPCVIQHVCVISMFPRLEGLSDPRR